jgi:hypothetical protein
LFGVIARLVRNCALERAIQYPETSVLELMGRRVLDAPPARDNDSGGHSFAFSRHEVSE